MENSVYSVHIVTHISASLPSTIQIQVSILVSLSFLLENFSSDTSLDCRSAGNEFSAIVWLKCFLSHLYCEEYFHRKQNSGLTVFFEHFKYAIPLSSGLTQFLKKHSLMHYIVSKDNLWVLLILLYLMCLFSS